MKSFYILPTGDEIKKGIVLDLDAPEIMKQIICEYPEAEVNRLCPIVDEENTILRVVNEIVQRKPDLIVLIGGSGGGHRFSKSLGKDFTHSALEKYLDKYASHEIYGKNGHMWTKLLCGKIGDTVIINVPGPYVEASAAFRAFLEAFKEKKSLDEISLNMAEAVLALFPNGAAKAI